MSEDGSVQWPPPGGPLDEQQYEALKRGAYLRMVDENGNELPLTLGPVSGTEMRRDGSMLRYQEHPDGSRSETELTLCRRRLRWRVQWTTRLITNEGVAAVTGYARSQERAERDAERAAQRLRLGAK